MTWRATGRAALNRTVSAFAAGAVAGTVAVVAASVVTDRAGERGWTGSAGAEPPAVVAAAADAAAFSGVVRRAGGLSQPWPLGPIGPDGLALFEVRDTQRELGLLPEPILILASDPGGQALDLTHLPAPGSVAVLGLGALVAARRSRQGRTRR